MLTILLVTLMGSVELRTECDLVESIEKYSLFRFYLTTM